MTDLRPYYKVTIYGYCRVNGSTRFVPIIEDQDHADSPKEAAYQIMEHWDKRFVDRVDVTLPDGAILQWNNLLYKNVYDVALYRRGEENELPVVDTRIETESPLRAALKIMQYHKLTHVAVALVSCPDGSTWRKEHLKIERREENTHE